MLIVKYDINGEAVSDFYAKDRIMNVKDNLTEIDRQSCFNEFENFKILHDKEINRIKNLDNKTISSMGV